MEGSRNQVLGLEVWPRSISLRSLLGYRYLGFVLAAAFLAAAVPVKAQESAVHYIEYPGTLGKVQALEWSGVPKWATLDVQLRGRLEGQSSYSYTSDNGQVYLLTRNYVGLQVRPTKFPYVDAITYFARAVGAARSGNPTAAKADIANLIELRDKLKDAKDAYWSNIVDIQQQGHRRWAGG